MFSKDKHHYGATPRTVKEAFGPYAEFKELRIYRHHGRLIVIAGVIVLGVIYGLLMGWRG